MARSKLVAPARQWFELASEEGEAGAKPRELLGDGRPNPAAGAGDRRVKSGEWPRLRRLHRRTLG
jgi:hypothetical protein